MLFSTGLSRFATSLWTAFTVYKRLMQRRLTIISESMRRDLAGFDLLIVKGVERGWSRNENV